MANPNELKMSITDVAEIKELLQEIRDDHKQLKYAIQGNPLISTDKGIVGKIKEIEDAQEETDEKVSGILESGKKLRWAVGGGMAVGGVFVGIIQVIIEVFIK